MSANQVFISYAWGGESELVANELEALFTQKMIDLVRDKSDLGFKGLIREFMQQIGQGNLVILIISDKYLKSKNCMFELMEVDKKGEFLDRIFPIVISDADIYDSLGILKYLKYWDQKIKDLNTSAKELENLADTRKVQEDINLYTDIRGAIDDLAGKLSNMNTLTLEIMRGKQFQPLFDALEQKLSSPAPPLGPSKKEGKVLYHIPGMMQVSEWTRCTVRLAWEEILLTEGLKIPKEEQIIESIRLGNIMQVSLIESRDGKNFEIHSLSNEEQFISEDEYTEWLFDVRALSLGKFSLVLRITLVQVIEGKERKKDIVLEREVTTESKVPKALPKFETAQSGIQIPNSPVPPTDFSQVYPEMAEPLDDELKETHHFPRNVPRLPNNPTTSPPTAKNLPREADPPQTITPVFKRVIPYAASLAGLVMIAFLFLFQNNSSEIENSGELASEGSPLPEPPPLGTSNQEKTFIAMSLEAEGPAGESISEVLIFGLEKSQLDSLGTLELGPYVITGIPQEDSVTADLSRIKTYSITEIQDSLTRITKRPIQVGNQQILRKDLRLKRNF